MRVIAVSDRIAGTDVKSWSFDWSVFWRRERARTIGYAVSAKQICNPCVRLLSQTTDSRKSFSEISIFGRCKLRQQLAEGDIVCLTVFSGFKDYADALNARLITDLDQVAEVIEQVLSRDFLQLG